jgi:hypothetical protein
MTGMPVLDSGCAGWPAYSVPACLHTMG